jgi:ATP-dependent DNA ligase
MNVTQFGITSVNIFSCWQPTSCGRYCRHGQMLLRSRTGTAAAAVSDQTEQAMRLKPLPVAFVVPAQPVKASKPPSGTDWVHEIKHDGYRMIVRRDGQRAGSVVP